MTERDGRLRIERVTKRVGADSALITVVKDCSFTVESGKFTVLVGPSGCGKTTLINRIAGYEPATSGSVKRFYIQDVSQRPLLVLAPKRKSAAEGGQYIVTDMLRRIDDELGIVADTLKPARVVAGGRYCKGG